MPELKKKLSLLRNLLYVFILAALVLIIFLADLGVELFGLLSWMLFDYYSQMDDNLVRVIVRPKVTGCFDAFYLVAYSGVATQLVFSRWLTHAAAIAAKKKPAAAQPTDNADRLFFGSLLPLFNVIVIKRAFEDIRSRYGAGEQRLSAAMLKGFCAANVAGYLCVGTGLVFWFVLDGPYFLEFGLGLLVCATVLWVCATFLAARLAAAVTAMIDGDAKDTATPPPPAF